MLDKVHEFCSNFIRSCFLLTIETHILNVKSYFSYAVCIANLYFAHDCAFAVKYKSTNTIMASITAHFTDKCHDIKYSESNRSVKRKILHDRIK